VGSSKLASALVPRLLWVAGFPLPTQLSSEGRRSIVSDRGRQSRGVSPQASTRCFAVDHIPTLVALYLSDYFLSGIKSPFDDKPRASHIPSIRLI
jgi:hypothetical protein